MSENQRISNEIIDAWSKSQMNPPSLLTRITEALDAKDKALAELEAKYDERCNLIHDIYVMFWGDGADDLKSEKVNRRIYYHKMRMEDRIKSLEAEVEIAHRANSKYWIELKEKDARLSEAVRVLEKINAKLTDGALFEVELRARQILARNFLQSPANQSILERERLRDAVIEAAKGIEKYLHLLGSYDAHFKECLNETMRAKKIGGLTDDVFRVIKNLRGALIDLGNQSHKAKEEGE